MIGRIKRFASAPKGRLAARAALIVAVAAAIGADLAVVPALSQNAECERLRQAISEASANGQSAQFQAAAERQQAELDRMSAYARSIGCENHRFLFFGSNPPPQCDQIDAQIGRMRANLQDLRARAGGGPGGRGELIARYNAECRGAPQQPGNLLDALFGQHPSNDVATVPLTPEGGLEKPGDAGEARAGSQAVCVKSCDGSFFPVSYAASGGRLEALDDMCRALCPNAEVSLYTYPANGEIEQAVSITGARYVDSPNALKFRQSYDPNCSCRRKGQSWAEALAGAEAKLGAENKGDIIVTPQKSAELSRPKLEVKPDPKAKGAKGAKPGATPTPSPAASAGGNAVGTDVNGVDTQLSAQAATISRETTAIGAGADAGATTIGEGQGKVITETGPDGVKRRVRIVAPAL